MGELTGPWGAHARAARNLLGWTVADVAHRAGLPVERAEAHERDRLASRNDAALLQRAYEAAGIVFHEWPDGAPLGVSIHFGFLSERQLIEAGRGWLKWRRRKLAKLAGLPMDIVNFGPLSPSQFDACETALRRAGCGLWRDRGGKWIGVRALHHPGAARVRFSLSTAKARAWE